MSGREEESEIDLYWGVQVAEWKRFRRKAILEHHRYKPLSASLWITHQSTALDLSKATLT